MAELKSRSAKAGEVIFRFGDNADCAYIVESGEVAIIMGLDDQNSDLAIVSKGELLGEMGIIDNAKRAATAIARTNCVLTIVDKEQLHARLATADPVIQLILTVILDRVRSLLHPTHVKTNAALQNIGMDFIKLENELKAGLEENELKLFLQPIADTKTKKIAGFEALIRWNHPKRGLISPDLFIKLAEDSGIILEIGRWILLEACTLAQRLENNKNNAGVYKKGAFISINVSTPQFKDPNFIRTLKEVLEETKIPPHRVKLEITESCLSDAEAAKNWIYRVKALGVRISLDDFGTGYSSLSYLHEYELDTIKIDQSFIKKMLSNERSLHIVDFIMKLADKLCLDIIAEGIESQVQFDKLKELGCHYIQGYIISKPKPIDEYFT